MAHVATADLALRYLLFNQLRSLQHSGFQVTGISAPGKEVTTLQNDGVRHVSVPMTRRFTPWADLVALWRLYRVMRRERFTIVHTHNPKPGLLGQLAARLAGVPIIINTVHGFYFHDHMHPLGRRFYVALEKIAARCSHAILSQNREDMETAVRERICPRGKIHFLGNGIDLDRFDRRTLDPETLVHKRVALGLPAEAPVVGFVGRLVREKGILELFEAARLVLQAVPGTRFLIIGPLDRDKPDAVKPDEARRFGVADAFTFAGLRHDLPDLYALMDVFVLPSHREGFPRAPMEAAAMEVPCVVTDVRGCREAVDPGRNGLLVPLGDVPALAKAILELLMNPARARALGAEGRHVARERFDEQLVFSKVRTAYQLLLEARGLAGPEGRPASAGTDA